jgi:hypothetical protein
MNPAAIKLFLTILWLVPGLGFLAHDLWTGRVIGVPFGQWQLPLSVPCLLFAAFNFIRWWSMRSRVTARFALRHRRPPPKTDPDPAFRFDDPSEPTAEKP